MSLFPLTGADYRGLLYRLLPKGPVWSVDEDSRLYKLLSAIGDELARVHADFERLVEEADPRTTDELLEDWEEALGLPGDCFELPATKAERREVLTAAIVGKGGSSEAYFARIVEALGYTDVEITTADPFRVDEDTVGTPLYDESWGFAWIVTATGLTEDAILSCLLNKLKPAHTVVAIGYEAPESEE